MNFEYTKNELYQALSKTINKDNEIVFITGDLSYLGKGDFIDKQDTLETFYSYFKEIGGNKATIVVPTFSQYLANTDIPFEIKNTPTNMGVFPNYVLKKNSSIRSKHPFTSFTADGAKASYICTGNLNFPYGIDSPYERILSLKNPLAICIGLEPRITGSIVHHAEFNLHVPYRYIKEFDHPVKYEDNLKYERFYMHVIYPGLNEKRDNNKKVFEYFERSNKVNEQNLGKGVIYSYDLKDLYNSVFEQMKKDLYLFLTEEPSEKPYRF